MADETQSMRVVPKSSFLRLVYPFLFDPNPFQDRIRATEAVEWDFDGKSKKVWQPRLSSFDDLMPHVARYFHYRKQDASTESDEANTSTTPAAQDSTAGRGKRIASRSGTEATNPGTACHWEMTEDCRKSPHGMGAQLDWTLTLPPSGTQTRVLRLTLEAVELALFSSGVGFVILKITTNSTEVDDWADLQCHARYAGGRERLSLEVRRRTGPGVSEPFSPAPKLSDGTPPGHAADPSNLRAADLIQVILQSAGLQDGSLAQTRPVFVRGRMIPFLVLTMESTSDAGGPKDAEVGLPVRRMIYRLRRRFHSRQPLHPSRDDLRLSRRWLLPYALRQWFYFSLEGGGFLSIDPPQHEFFRVQMQNHLDHEYFVLYLMTLMQRFTLIGLSDDVARHWNRDDRKNRRELRQGVFDRIRESLFHFTARGYFSSVVQEDNHHRFYRRWQKTLQVAELYDEVREEVREMHEYLTDRQRSRRDELVGLLSLLLSILIGAPALVIGFLNINIQGVTTESEGMTFWGAVGVVLAGMVFAGAFYTAVWRVFRSRFLRGDGGVRLRK